MEFVVPRFYLISGYCPAVVVWPVSQQPPTSRQLHLRSGNIRPSPACGSHATQAIQPHQSLSRSGYIINLDECNLRPHWIDVVGDTKTRLSSDPLPCLEISTTFSGASVCRVASVPPLSASAGRCCVTIVGVLLLNIRENRKTQNGTPSPPHFLLDLLIYQIEKWVSIFLVLGC